MKRILFLLALAASLAACGGGGDAGDDAGGDTGAIVDDGKLVDLLPGQRCRAAGSPWIPDGQCTAAMIEQI